MPSSNRSQGPPSPSELRRADRKRRNREQSRQSEMKNGIFQKVGIS